MTRTSERKLESIASMFERLGAGSWRELPGGIYEVDLYRFGTSPTPATGSTRARWIP